jgi:hypothetical protein
MKKEEKKRKEETKAITFAYLFETSVLIPFQHLSLL